MIIMMIIKIPIMINRIIMIIQIPIMINIIIIMRIIIIIHK